MKVILLADVTKLGRKYDVTEVSDGYASNFLLPRKLAEPATSAKVKNIENLKKQQVVEREVQHELLLKNFDELTGAKISIAGKANEKGHLFQGIHKEEIADALFAQTNISIDADMIQLDQPIKSVGEFDIEVTIEKKSGTFKLEVNPSS